MNKIIDKFKGNPLAKYIFWTTVVYVSAHWFLVVVSGVWWDDWAYAVKDWNHLLEACKQSSLPLRAYILASTWLLPDGFNTVLTFVYYYAGAILVYLILRKIDLFTEEACFWIGLLYNIIPINDARILWICYSYGVGLLLFWVAFYLSTIWKTKYDNRISALRIVSLVILLISFDTESIMLMTLLILAYFYYTDMKKVWEKNAWKNNFIYFLKSVIKHIDYLIAPMAWYVLDKVFFPGYGAYAGHSYIPWGRLASITFVQFPKAAVMSLKVVIKYLLMIAFEDNVRPFIWIVVLVYIAVWIYMCKKKAVCQKEEPFQIKNIFMIALGIIAFLIGLYPYVVKYSGASDPKYLSGRNTMLLGIGMAVILYYGVYAIFKTKIYRLVLVSLLTMGVIYFNETYLDWQKSYYQQLQMEDEMAENQNILNNDTFLVMIKGADISVRPYQLSGNSRVATGESTRLYIPSTGELSMMLNMDENSIFIQSNAYNIKDYAYTDKTIDGIIFADYEDISYSTILKQKWNEIFHKDKFNEWIHESKNIHYASVSREESEEIIRMYSAGELSESYIYDMYYNK